MKFGNGFHLLFDLFGTFRGPSLWPKKTFCTMGLSIKFWFLYCENRTKSWSEVVLQNIKKMISFFLIDVILETLFNICEFFQALWDFPIFWMKIFSKFRHQVEISYYKSSGENRLGFNYLQIYVSATIFRSPKNENCREFCKILKKKNSFSYFKRNLNIITYFYLN